MFKQEVHTRKVLAAFQWKYLGDAADAVLHQDDLESETFNLSQPLTILFVLFCFNRWFLTTTIDAIDVLLKEMLLMFY